MKLQIENALPTEYNRVLSLRGLVLEADLIGDMMKVPVHAFTKYLALKKDRADESTALVLRDEKGNFIIAGVVEYHKPEKEDQAGNWSYEFTFEEKDIENSHQYLVTDPSFMEVLQRVAMTHSIVITDMQFAFDLIMGFFVALKNVLENNVTTDEEVEIESDGFFVATAGIENDEKAFALVPSGEMKRLIKDDSTLEG